MIVSYVVAMGGGDALPPAKCLSYKVKGTSSVKSPDTDRAGGLNERNEYRDIQQRE